jgi:hypothetical protein
MKYLAAALALVLTCQTQQPAAAGECRPADCTSCKNCVRCKRCQDGRTCNVCRAAAQAQRKREELRRITPAVR